MGRGMTRMALRWGARQFGHAQALFLRHHHDVGLSMSGEPECFVHDVVVVVAVVLLVDQNVWCMLRRLWSWQLAGSPAMVCMYLVGFCQSRCVPLTAIFRMQCELLLWVRGSGAAP